MASPPQEGDHLPARMICHMVGGAVAIIALTIGLVFAEDAPKPRRRAVRTATASRNPQSRYEPLTQREFAFHALNRLAFGPRPGQVDQVQEIGWKTWARQQLDPKSIDDSELERRLESDYPSLKMSMTEIFAKYRPEYENPTPEQRGMVNELREDIRRELPESVLFRAVASQRQLQEVLVEFWRNHFNIDQNKDEVVYLAPHYEQHVIRKHLFGKFQNMLLASASHPAMLIYLDNIISQKPLARRDQRLVERYRGRQRKPVTIRALERHRGLNENYARELMELHTLGVKNENVRGGYRQHDVIEVARVLTGWSAGYTDDEYGFVFRHEVHDVDPKVILRHKISGRGGVADGAEVIRMLANHPATAKFIATKLCRYLVNDNPPADMVRQVARTFRKTRGNLKKVYEAIIFSPHFVDRANYRVKFKTPYEFTVSALRITDAQIADWGPTRRALKFMGQPIYQMDDPTGYDDRTEAWLNPGVLLYRWDYAMRLGEGRVEGITISTSFFTSLPRTSSLEMSSHLVGKWLPGGLDTREHQMLTRAVKRYGKESVMGLVLGTPTFQQQ